MCQIPSPLPPISRGYVNLHRTSIQISGIAEYQIQFLEEDIDIYPSCKEDWLLLKYKLIVDYTRKSKDITWILFSYCI